MQFRTVTDVYHIHTTLNLCREGRGRKKGRRAGRGRKERIKGERERDHMVVSVFSEGVGVPTSGCSKCVISKD